MADCEEEKSEIINGETEPCQDDPEQTKKKKKKKKKKKGLQYDFIVIKCFITGNHTTWSTPLISWFAIY